MARLGCSLVLVDLDSEGDGLEALQREIGDSTVAVPADVTDLAAGGRGQDRPGPVRRVGKRRDRECGDGCHRASGRDRAGRVRSGRRGEPCIRIRTPTKSEPKDAAQFHEEDRRAALMDDGREIGAPIDQLGRDFQVPG